MAKIKSALEIALERSTDIDVDLNKIKEKELIKKGKALVGTYLNDLNKKPKDVLNKLKKYKDNDYNLVKKGIVDTIINNIKLPRDKVFDTYFNHISNLFISLADDKEQATTGFENINKLFLSYNESKEQLLEKIKEQFAPMNQNPNIPLEQNPEFMKILENNFNSLNDQAQEMLNNFIEQIKMTISKV